MLEWFFGSGLTAKLIIRRKVSEVFGVIQHLFGIIIGVGYLNIFELFTFHNRFQNRIEESAIWSQVEACVSLANFLMNFGVNFYAIPE